MPGFEEWESFYIIVGAGAAALIGLQFVVMTLLADRPPAPERSAAYATPTIVHFSAVLLLSALIRVPSHGIAVAAARWGLTGVCGFVYELIVMRRMRAQSRYENAFEDWFFQWCCRSRPTRCSPCRPSRRSGIRSKRNSPSLPPR